MRQALQTTLWSTDEAPAIGPLHPHRTPLSHGAWIDLLPGWLTGADALFDHLAENVPWVSERRRMYDAVVDVPRLLAFYSAEMPLPHAVLSQARDALSGHYAELFTTAGLCYYRTGADSVAWHGDTQGRGAHADTFVAIVSVGAPRVLALRPREGGGVGHRIPLGHGDLLVMGGSCQRTWEHAIPKTSKAVGPRISIQFRPPGVR
ncbi:alpha-ketoglutarate-dependent dioxygenase AlkB [Actinokineospora sp. G85]|uniref:alpha-ketoglutarate-dependent dioxygenase AlkB n=1 Tax=Actinokineospora sp. G85 TaxID=3406626 RepID=UPI003C710417